LSCGPRRSEGASGAMRGLRSAIWAARLCETPGSGWPSRSACSSSAVAATSACKRGAGTGAPRLRVSALRLTAKETHCVQRQTYALRAPEACEVHTSSSVCRAAEAPRGRRWSSTRAGGSGGGTPGGGASGAGAASAGLVGGALTARTRCRSTVRLGRGLGCAGAGCGGRRRRQRHMSARGRSARQAEQRRTHRARNTGLV